MKRIALSILVSFLVAIHAHSQQKTIQYRIPIELPADLLEGGRANTVVVSSWHPNEFYVASDSGGLFKSTEWGNVWTHVDSLPAMFTQSVIYLDEDSLLVTAKADFKAINGGGLWRTDDNGLHWTQVPLSVPNSTKRLSAYGISRQNNNIVVGTSEGIFASMDGGAHFEYSDPFRTLPFATKEIYSVLVDAGSPPRIYAGGRYGVRLGTLTVPLDHEWRSPSFAPSGPILSIHAFESSPIQWDHALLTTSTGLFYTELRGTDWAQIPGPPGQHPGTCGGAPFVQVARNFNDPEGVIDVYYGTGCSLYRIRPPVEKNSPRFDLVLWHELLLPRIDQPRDLLMWDADLVMLATNGGLLVDDHDGEHWRYVGGGRNGYNAIQMTDLKGQFIDSVEYLDLYAATRDNFLWAMDIEGTVGQHRKPVEAYFLEAERHVDFETNTRITWARQNPVDNRQSKRLLLGEMAWNSPLNSRTAAPVLLRRNQYVQNTRTGLAWWRDVTDPMSHWETFGVFGEEPRGLPVLGRAGAGDQSVVFQTFKANPTPAQPRETTQLLRVDFSPGNSTVTYLTDESFKGLGFTTTHFGIYPVYGVDSRDPSHIIAPDIIDGKMKETIDGGPWTEITGLTDQIMRIGTPRELVFQTTSTDLDEAPLVTAVSFSPDDPDLVLIGTREGGIYMSGDRGKNWSRITNSEQVTNVTSFFWANANTIFVSTYGRGLWKLQNTVFTVPGMFDQHCGSCDVVSDFSSGPPRFDASVMVFNGRVFGVRTEKGLLREVFVTPGSSVVFTGDPKDIAITRTDGTGPYEPLPKGPDGSTAVAVVFTTDGTYAGAAYSKSLLSLLPPQSEGDCKGSTESPTKGRPYIRLTTSSFNGVPAAAPNEVIALTGTDFDAGASYELLVDGTPLEEVVTADKYGSLDARLSAPSEAGSHHVQVRMAKDETVLDGSLLLVIEAK